MKKKNIRLTKIILILLCILTLVACDSSKINEESKDEKNIEENTNNKNLSNDKNKDEKLNYAEDEVVNNFIANYNSFSNSPIDNIEKGNIRTKYFGETFGYFLEMINSSDTNKISVTINKTNENANIGIEGMKEVFHDVIKTIIGDAIDNDINSYFDNLVSNEYMVTEEAFNKLEIIFLPDKELSKGQSRGHIEIRAK